MRSTSRGSAYFADPSTDPEAFLRGFLSLAGSAAELPSSLPPPLEQSVRLLMVERFAGDAVIPLQALRAAPFPKLVVSGAHNPSFTAVCEVLPRELNAEHAVIAGKARSAQRTGAPFNERLDAFLRKVEAASPDIDHGQEGRSNP